MSGRGLLMSFPGIDHGADGGLGANRLMEQSSAVKCFKRFARIAPPEGSDSIACPLLVLPNNPLYRRRICSERQFRASADALQLVAVTHEDEMGIETVRVGSLHR